MAIRVETDPALAEPELEALWRAAWGKPPHPRLGTVLARSLAHVAAFDGARLVGFVNLAWDGGIHAFLLDPCVHPDYRRRGIATRMVAAATAAARDRGAHWLHVDFTPALADFYRGCGFRPTMAGLIELRTADPGD